MPQYRLRSAVRIASALLLVVAAAGGAGAATPAPEPWELLADLRAELSENGPLIADFEHTYIPAGFESGESEGGTLAIALPDCLRWDYTWPFYKTYLLCGDRVHSWNPGEASGRQYPVERSRAPGLDLLLLGIDRLQSRYEATLLPAEDGHTRVRLVPTEPIADLTSAVFTIDAARSRLIALEWTDTESSRTRFELSDLRPLGRLELFSPPADLEWISE